MNEKLFNTEVVNSLKHEGAWAYKIPDMPSSLMAGGRFNPDKPCDVVGCAEGRFIGIESKQFKEIKGFSLRYLRYNQVDSLNQMHEAGGRAYVFLNIRVASPRENRLIIFSWGKWRDVLETKIVPKKLIMELPHIKGKKKKFDLEDFCNLIGMGIDDGFGPENYMERLSERRTREST